MLAATLLLAAACGPWGQPGKLLHSDDFKGSLDQWVPEYAAKPGSTIAARNGTLTMDLAGDATLDLTTPGAPFSPS